MLDSDFWRELAERFRRLDPGSTLRAEWSLPFGVDSSESWQIIGDGNSGPSLCAQFEPIATRAGLKLKKNPGNISPLDIWLIEVKSHGPQIDFVGPSGSVFQDSGRITNLCQVSADVCNVLEARALDAEHSASDGSEPVTSLDFKAHHDEPQLKSRAPETESTPQVDSDSSLGECSSAGPNSQSEQESEAWVSPSLPVNHQETVESVAADRESAPVSQANLPLPPPPPLSHPEQRRKQVEDFLQKCNAISQEPIRKRHLWRSVGHHKGRQFEYWQRGNLKATEADNRNFSRILGMPPEEFISTLRQKGLLK